MIILFLIDFTTFNGMFKNTFRWLDNDMILYWCQDQCISTTKILKKLTTNLRYTRIFLYIHYTTSVLFLLGNNFNTENLLTPIYLKTTLREQILLSLVSYYFEPFYEILFKQASPHNTTPLLYSLLYESQVITWNRHWSRTLFSLGVKSDPIVFTKWGCLLYSHYCMKTWPYLMPDDREPHFVTCAWHNIILFALDIWATVNCTNKLNVRWQCCKKWLACLGSLNTLFVSFKCGIFNKSSAWLGFAWETWPPN